MPKRAADSEAWAPNAQSPVGGFWPVHNPWATRPDDPPHVVPPSFNPIPEPHHPAWPIHNPWAAEHAPASAKGVESPVAPTSTPSMDAGGQATPVHNPWARTASSSSANDWTASAGPSTPPAPPPAWRGSPAGVELLVDEDEPNAFSFLPPLPSQIQTISGAMLQPLSVRLTPLMSLVLQDRSEQALRPEDPSMLISLLQGVAHAVDSAVRPGTLKKDKQAWRLWLAFTADVGTAPVRDDDPSHFARETFLVAAFIIWLTSRLKSTIPGRLLCKAATYLGLCYAVKRNHVRLGKRFECLSMAKAVVKTLNTEYARREGPECLIPARKEPLSRAMLRLLLAAPGALNLHNRTVPRLVWSSWFGLNLAAMLCVAASGGFRKAELCLDQNTEFDAMHMSRASLFWVINGVVVRCPTVAQLQNLQVGDKAGLLACPAKNDPWGCFFMPHPLFFNFLEGKPDNTAARLRDMVIGCPVPPGLMRSTPLFTLGPGAGRQARPLRHQLMDTVLKALLRTFLDETTAKRYSWHSFRIGLACSLQAAGASEAIIPALCRWRSPASIRIYARINSSVSAAWVGAAGTQALNSVQSPNPPNFQAAAQAACACFANPVLPATGATAGIPTVPGALLPHVYEPLVQVESNPDAPSAADLLLLHPTEIDLDRWVEELVGLNFAAQDDAGEEPEDFDE